MDLADCYPGEAVNQTVDSEHVGPLEWAMNPYRGQNGNWQVEVKQLPGSCSPQAEMTLQVLRRVEADLGVISGQICQVQ